MRGRLSAALVALIVLAPVAGAQLETQQVDERLPLTDQAPPQAPSGSGPVCGNVQVHGIADPGQGPEQAKQADMSRSSAVLGCPTLFHTASPGAFNVTGEATVHLFVGCQEPTVMHQPLNNVRVWLVRNGEAISEGGGSLATTCTPGEPLEIEIPIEQPEDTAFNASDTLGLNVTVFGSPNAALDNLHVLVGGNATASALVLPGVGQAFVAEEASDEATNGTNETDAFGNASQLDQQSTDGGENGTPAPGVGVTLAALAAIGLARRSRSRRA